MIYINLEGVVYFICECGVDINLKIKNDWIVFYEVIWVGNENIVWWLFKDGVDVNVII